MFNTRKSRLHYALTMWANYIETGNVVLSAFDASRQKMPVNPLSKEQTRIVYKLRADADGILDGRIHIPEG